MLRKQVLALVLVVLGGLALAGALGSTVVQPAAAGANSPAHLGDQGWACPVLLGFVHCLPPGTALKSGGSPSLTALVFDTQDPNATDAAFLGMEHVLRADVFEKGGRPPCPQDPPTFEYRDLRTTALNIPYYACHRYDSSF
jgi:hypothetical protein